MCRQVQTSSSAPQIESEDDQNENSIAQQRPIAALSRISALQTEREAGQTQDNRTQTAACLPRLPVTAPQSQFESPVDASEGTLVEATEPLPPATDLCLNNPDRCGGAT